GKLDDTATRMFSREIVAAEFPQRRVEITDVDHISAYEPNLDPIANAIWLAHENVDPANETRNRRLQCEPEYQRDQAKRNDRGVPVLKKDRQYKKPDCHPDDQSRDAFQVVLVNRIPHATNEVNINQVQDHQANNNHCDRQNQLEHQRIRSRKTRQTIRNQLVRRSESH